MAVGLKPSTETVLGVLAEEGGNIRKTADRLMLSRQQLYRLLEGVPGFDLEDFRKDLESKRAQAPKDSA
jgi:DNA-binding NtrC family response regulator